MEHSYRRNKTLLINLEHEVRQILHHLMGMLELAAEAPSSPAQAAYLSQCRARADQLLQMANDVAELSSPERLPPPVSSYCVRVMVEQVAEVMAALARGRGLDFSWSVDASVPRYVFGDREIIQDTLRRILDNGIKFTARGTITLSVNSTPLGESDSVLLAFEARGTGPGIAEKGQLHARDGSPHTRLDFMIVQKRLADVNGDFSLESNTPGGAAIRISLPAKSAAAPPSALETGAGDPAGQPHAAIAMKLLVAEDSDDSFNVFQAYVKGEGHAVSRAFNGAEAVEIAKTNDFDLIVMDIDMPVMDGYTATRSIREWETKKGRTRIPIVLLSAESAARQRRIGASVGCSGYLTKPVPKSEVLKTLRYFSGRA